MFETSSSVTKINGILDSWLCCISLVLLYTQEFKFITALKQWGSIFLLGSVDRQRSTKFKFLVCTVSVAITFCVSLFCVPVRSVCRQRSTEFESPDCTASICCCYLHSNSNFSCLKLVAVCSCGLVNRQIFTKLNVFECTVSVSC